jgi:Xaa-Pro aminopeptidase
MTLSADLQTLYQQRRAHLAAAMRALSPAGGVAIIPTAPEVMRNRDSDYPYRHDSYFYYLTGFTEPESTLVLLATPDQTRSVLLCREKNVEREIWDGFRLGPAAAPESLGVDVAHAITDIDTELPKLLANCAALFYATASHSALDAQVRCWMDAIRAQNRAGVSAPRAAFDVNALLDEMRLFKDAHEIALMRQAADISAAAHSRAMQATRAGKFEYEIEAELLHEFHRSGSPFPAYGSIVAGGANACVLHYRANDAQLRDGDLLLIDAGCEWGGYASDITRTFPVNGRFSAAQRELYEIVLAAQAAALDCVKPGAHWNDAHDAAVRVLAQGLLDTGLCQGSLDGVLESGDYKKFYMHRTGHWLGMDVHDVGEYREVASTANEKPWRVLQPGMVLTVEPGLYVRPGDGVPERYWNIGIRIEDDVLVTEHGHEVLSKNAPKTVADIEALMNVSAANKSSAAK